MTRQERRRNHIAHITDDFIRDVNKTLSFVNSTAIHHFQKERIKNLKRVALSRIEEGERLKDLHHRSWNFPIDRPSPRFSVFGDYDPYSLKE